VNRAQKRLASIGAALALLLSGAALLAPGASAVLKPAILLTPNKAVQIHGGPFVGVTRPYETANGTLNASDGNQFMEPTHCDGSDPTDPAASDCDRIPLKLNVPKTDLGKKDFLIAIRIDWQVIGTVRDVPATGDVNIHQLDAYLWQNPIPHVITDGKDTGTNAPPSLSSINENSPIKMALVDPPVLNWDLVITNRAGPDSDGYDLSITLQDLTGPLPVDLSVDTLTNPPLSSSPVPAPKAASVASAPAAATPTPEAVNVPTLPGLAGVAPDSQLDAAGGAPLDLNPVQGALARQANTLGPPGPASGLGLVLWLVVLPVVLLGLGGAWFARRRSGLMQM